MRAAVYRDRDDAGRRLAAALAAYAEPGTVVLAIPNGGVAVAGPVARALGCPLHLMVVRKILFPHTTEAGFGAVSADGTTVIDQTLAERAGLSAAQIETQRQGALKSVTARLARYGARAEPPPLAGRTVILVDDGLASGSTMEAAVRIARSQGPGRIVVAAPTASARAVDRLEPLVDDLVCPHVGTGPIFAVAEAYGRWYDVSEDEVERLLDAFSSLSAADPG
jgi:putative phosphoribosyl transferase